MQALVHDHFLLKSETARALYDDYAKKMPVIDYHCHISPRELYENRRFENLAELWLGGDHYKWRVMRANGVDERYITGDASPYEKFEAWAAVVPRLIGNPLYHWTHLELARYFGIFDLLCSKTAPAIWERANEQLQALPARNILEHARVKALCTTDDPSCELQWHKLLKKDPSFHTLVLPTFRPDRAMDLNRPGFADYLKKLGAAAGVTIRSLDDVKEALARRVEFFAQMGCLTADHGFDAIVCEHDPALASAAFSQAFSGMGTDARGQAAYRTELLLFLARLYKKHGFVMQLHYGVARDLNPVLYGAFGPDAGCDCISGGSGANFGKLLGVLEKEDALLKAIVYPLNPADNVQAASVIGCFQGAGVRGRMQLGSAWWFNDTKPGIEAQLTSFAQSSVLPNFVGMLTDSRSLLSYARHEYFRRILCNLLGEWVENGEYPRDMEALGAMVEDICYNNAVSYFGFAL